MVKDLLPHIKHCCVLNSYHQEQKTKVKKKIAGRVKPKRGVVGFDRIYPLRTTDKKNNKSKKTHTRLAQTPPKKRNPCQKHFSQRARSISYESEEDAFVGKSQRRHAGTAMEKRGWNLAGKWSKKDAALEKNIRVGS